MKSPVTALMFVSAFFCFAAPILADDAKPGEAVTSDLEGQLRIAQPVNLHEPANTLPHACTVGDVFVLPIQYPISPPFPKSATASSDGAAVTAKDVVRASGQLAYLTMKPQTGRIGVGYLLVLVKAVEPGKATVNVKVTLADGKVKEVPFAIKVDADGK